MRHSSICLFLLLVGVAPLGCTPGITDTGSGDALDIVSNLLGIHGADDGDGSEATESSSTAQAIDAGMTLSGSVIGSGAYQLFDLGTVSYGEEVSVASANPLNPTTYLVVLLDANHDLLMRYQVSLRNPLTHVLRADTPVLYVGVAPTYGSNGGTFTLQVQRRSDTAVPGPRQQVAWVNFGGGSNVSVHRRTGLSFPAFDAGRLDAKYAGQTATIKAAIMAAMRDDYAAHNVLILSSDDGPPPAGPYATIHIGGDDNRLLGLADNVDQYNTDLGQTAVVFVDAFADFAVMNLSVDEMGQMIGNTASHELGHLLGLFHTRKPDDIMDTTGTAWHLTQDQAFTRGELEQTVFPVGYENSPQRLTETVGYKPGGAAKSQSTEKSVRSARLRAIIEDELRCRCGTCLNPDE